MPNNNSNPSVLGIVVRTTLVVGTLSSLGWYYYFTAFQNNKADDCDDDERPSQQLSELRDADNKSSLIKPPFPQTLRDMLSKCRLAYLSTVYTMAKSSHLSLMRFTYVHDPEDGEVIIMSTNKNTKKFEMLRQQRGVALLVHDFDKAQSDSDGSSNSYSNNNSPPSTRSITLNGNCRILSGPDEDRYRKAHLAHNPDYPQFIVGEDIAVLCIDVTSARICDLNDKVVHWNVLEGGAN
jgi:hypothetical protein